MTAAAQSFHSEDLLIGILAVLSLRKRQTLKISDKDFHSAFGSALAVFKEKDSDLAELAESYDRDVVTKTYDELNNALITAEGYSLLRFPNPSYSRLQITMTKAVAERLLEKLPGKRPVFEEAANALLERMAGQAG